MVPALPLSYRHFEELLVARGITVDHVSVYRWVQRFTPLLIDAARPCRHGAPVRLLVAVSASEERFNVPASVQFAQQARSGSASARNAPKPASRVADAELDTELLGLLPGGTH